MAHDDAPFPAPESLPAPSHAHPATRDLLDPAAARLLDGLPRREVPRTRQVFVNRNLQMDRVEAIGFDMDYTLAIYQRLPIEELSFQMTLQKLVEQRGYPAKLAAIQYDQAFVQRGLMVDRQLGNLFKMDRFAQVGRAFHGRRQLTAEEHKRAYGEERVKPSAERFASVDTLFALPEACLYAEIIEVLERDGVAVDYGRLYDDIRECIDTVHRDGSLKTEMKRDLARFIWKDPELGLMLHRLRSGGKKLFVATNSLWDYTDAVMRYLLDGVLPEYPSWRNYFDGIVVGASKPGFFGDTRPFFEVDVASGETRTEPATSFERSRVYQGGHLQAFEKAFGVAGEKVLYVGDHIYGDILRSRKSSLWRTCLVVQELEEEIAYTEAHSAEIQRLADLDVLRARLGDEVNQHKLVLNAAEKRLERMAPESAERTVADEERRHLKGELELLRKSLRETSAEADAIARQLESGRNPHWGLLFKEGNENSRFGEQVEQYACIYTSRVSNFLFHSPMQFFRSLRTAMPHERIHGHRDRFGLFGSDGPPRGARAG